MPGHPIRPVRASAHTRPAEPRQRRPRPHAGGPRSAWARGRRPGGRSSVRRSIIVVDRQPVVDIPLDDLDSPFPPYLGLRQCDLERLIERRVRDLGGDIRRGHEVTWVALDDTGVLISVRTPRGLEELRAGWLAGCGGLHRPVRAARGRRWRASTTADHGASSMPGSRGGRGRTTTPSCSSGGSP